MIRAIESITADVDTTRDRHPGGELLQFPRSRMAMPADSSRSRSPSVSEWLRVDVDRRSEPVLGAAPTAHSRLEARTELLDTRSRHVLALLDRMAIADREPAPAFPLFGVGAAIALLGVPGAAVAKPPVGECPSSFETASLFDTPAGSGAPRCRSTRTTTSSSASSPWPTTLAPT